MVSAFAKASALEHGEAGVHPLNLVERLNKSDLPVDQDRYRLAFAALA